MPPCRWPRSAARQWLGGTQIDNVPVDAIHSPNRCCPHKAVDSPGFIWPCQRGAATLGLSIKIATCLSGATDERSNHRTEWRHIHHHHLASGQEERLDQCHVRGVG